MLMYAAALMPLIQSLSTPACNQNWYTDDSAYITDLDHLSEWFELKALFDWTYNVSMVIILNQRRQC